MESGGVVEGLDFLFGVFLSGCGARDSGFARRIAKGERERDRERTGERQRRRKGERERKREKKQERETEKD